MGTGRGQGWGHVVPMLRPSRETGSSLATERRRPAQGPPLTTPSTARLHEGLLPHPLQLVAPVLCMAWVWTSLCQDPASLAFSLTMAG